MPPIFGSTLVNAPTIITTVFNLTKNDCHKEAVIAGEPATYFDPDCLRPKTFTTERWRLKVLLWH